MSAGLLILGAGGHGRVVADSALRAGYDRVAFLDDKASTQASGPFRILGTLAELAETMADWDSAFVAIGNNSRRLELFRELRRLGYQTPALVHPGATLSPYAKVADGAFIAPGAIINFGTTIGAAAIINTGSTIDHDCAVDAGAHISPGAHLAGEIVVGECAWIGIGASVINRIRIGAHSIVGAGAAVIRDVDAHATVVGVPAAPVRRS
jgi:sugar O-acyltransferase (sialic acid O-acetyltransferase NeuD family)